MPYKRKTKDVCALIWTSQYGTEEIDSFDTWNEAVKMRKEYLLAYGGSIRIKFKRERIDS
jgi:hypothetical protein